MSLLNIERVFNGDDLESICADVGWESDFEKADFKNCHYYLIREDKEPGALIILTPMGHGVADCHIAKRDMMSSIGLMQAANIVMELISLDYDALFCLIKADNRPARSFATRFGFRASGSVSDYKIYTREI